MNVFLTTRQADTLLVLPKSIRGLIQKLNGSESDSPLRVEVNKHFGQSVQEKLYNYLYDPVRNCECGRPLRFVTFSKGYANFCSVRCASSNTKTKNKKKLTIQKRYGTNSVFENEIIKEKIETTKIKRYGGHQMKNMDVANKRSTTMQYRYGGVGFNSEIINSKIKNTMLSNHGVEHNWQSEELKTQYLAARRDEFIKTKLPAISNYVSPLFQTEEYENSLQELKWKCTVCNHVFIDDLSNGRIPRCEKCFPPLIATSKPENELAEYIQQLGFLVERSTKPFSSNQSIDIFVPEKSWQLNLMEFIGILRKRGKPEIIIYRKLIYLKKKDLN